LTEFIEKIGKASMNATATFRDILFFAFTILARIFQKKTYNSAMKMVLVNQIYFTSVQILPLFTVLSIILGSLLIGIVLQIIKNLGLAEYLGRILMGLVVTEISPFVTVLLVALRSSSAMNAEIAVMKVNKELRTLDTYNIDVIDYLFVPRIINGVVSVLLLSALFSILALTSGMIFSKLIFGMSFDVYTNVLLKSADIYDIDIYLIKCCIFGFFITLIPIRSGLSASDDLTSIPIAVLQGMVKVFIAIIFIEVLSLILISL
jgi:phospholipid/cholesterol/gamma-HCH transport system permease protein